MTRNLGIVERTLGNWVAKARKNGEFKERPFELPERNSNVFVKSFRVPAARRVAAGPPPMASTRTLRDAELTERIRKIHKAHGGRVGVRRVRDELARAGVVCSHKHTHRLMRAAGLRSVHPRPETEPAGPGGAAAEMAAPPPLRSGDRP